MSSADNLCKHFGTRSGSTKRQLDLDPRLFDTRIPERICQKNIFKKIRKVIKKKKRKKNKKSKKKKKIRKVKKKRKKESADKKTCKLPGRQRVNMLETLAS